jgi:hypothetical protein
MDGNTRPNKLIRDTSIALSAEERRLLRKAASEMFGTTDVTYGTTIQHLVREATDIDVEEALSE